MQAIKMNHERRIRNRVFLLASCLWLAIPASVQATNGYFSIGMGTKNKAMAGAGIALPDEAMAVVNNPAVAVAVADSSVVGLAIFYPRANYDTSESSMNGQGGSFTIGPNDIDAEDQALLVPHFARSWQLQDNSAFAMALYARSGINTEYRGGTATFDPDGPGPEGVVTRPGTFGDGDVKWKLSQIMLDLGYARQVSDRFSLGVSGVLAAQGFSAKGLGSLAYLTETYVASGGSVMPSDLSGNGKDWSYGAGIKVGAHFQWTRNLSAGLMLQSKIYMSDFSDYSDLLPSGGSFDIPANIKFGLSYRVFDVAVFSLDVEHIFHGGVKALDQSIEDFYHCPTAGRGGTDVSSCLGGDNGGGLGWKDQTAIKFGLDWAVTQNWNFRAGFSFTSQPIPIGEASNNLLTPYLSESHYTLGFSRKLGKSRELNLALMYTEEESQHVPSSFDPSQQLNYEADQFELEVSYGWRF